MVAYIKSDLDFILAQIKIAEAHAGRQPLLRPGRADPHLQSLLGPAHGRRHLQQPAAPDLGLGRPASSRKGWVPTSGTVMVDPDGPGPSRRCAMPLYAGQRRSTDLAPCRARATSSIPALRTISNLIVDQTLGNPSAILTALQRAGV